MTRRPLEEIIDPGWAEALRPVAGRIAEAGDFFGRSVILAARIAAQAVGGEILVSEALREAAADRFGFDDGRELELKGLAGTHTVYRAEQREAATA